MNNSIYELNDMSFIAGETQDLFFRLYTTSNTQVSAEDFQCDFSIKRYGSLSNNAPLLSKSCEKITEVINGENINCFHVKLESDDTVNLYGLFIYQVTLKSPASLEVYQGILNIYNNINHIFTLS